jgi:hypothetical protein
LRIFTRRVCSLAPGMHPVSQTSTWHVEQNPGTAPKERHNNASHAANATPRLAGPNVVRPRAARCGRCTLTPTAAPALTGTCAESEHATQALETVNHHLNLGS